MRDFIKECLYHPSKGYFCNPANLQVGKLKEPLRFSKFLGYNDYIKALYDEYPPNCFLTPSETFLPFYGYTIANYIHQKHYKDKNSSGPFIIGKEYSIHKSN